MIVKISDINTESNMVNSLEQKLLKITKKRFNCHKRKKIKNLNCQIIQIGIEPIYDFHSYN